MIMAMIRPETEMKDSGIEWIGDIPSNWETTPLKKIVVDRAGGAWGNEPYENNSTICMRIADFDFDRGVFQDKSETELTKRSYKEYQIDKLLLQTNDICIEKSGGGEKTPVGRAVLFDKPYDALFANFLDRIRVDNAVSFPKYVEYYLRAMYFLSVTTLYIKQTTGIQNLNVTSLLEKEVITLPSLSEQQAIADYLDETCSKIDALIAEAKASIDEDKELKQAVIFEAVTKGLDKNVAMKDSGVEWIGNMPSHWNLVKSTRFITSTQNGMTRRDLDKSSGSIVLKLKNITENGDIDYSWVNRIDLTDKELDTYSLEQDDLLFVRVNGSKSLVGKCAIFEKQNENIAYNDHIIRVKLNDYCSSRFFRWYLLAQSGKTEIALHINTSAGQYTISGQGLRDIYVSLPPLNEQMQIVEYLEEKCLIFDGVIKDKQDMIEDLEAYKKSLIYEVVTGKRRVV